MVDTLGDSLPHEQARVRAMKAQYEALGVSGQLGALMMEQALRAADEAVISGDLAAMIVAYKELQTFTD